MDYDRTKQMQILKQLFSDTLYLLKFLSAIVALIALSTLLFIFLKSSQCKDKLLCEMQKLLTSFEKYHIFKSPHVSMQEFLSKTQKELDINLQEISRLYQQLKYAQEQNSEQFNSLKREIQRVKKELKKLKN